MRTEDDNDALHPWIEPDLEARLTALVLGEASDFERDELARLIAGRPELGLYQKRLEMTHRLLSEAAKGDSAEEQGEWRLSTERRDVVLSRLKGEAATDENCVVMSGAKRHPPLGMILRIAACVAVIGFFANLLRSFPVGALRNAPEASSVVTEFAYHDTRSSGYSEADRRSRENVEAPAERDHSLISGGAIPLEERRTEIARFGDREVDVPQALAVPLEAPRFDANAESPLARHSLTRGGDEFAGSVRKETRDGVEEPMNSLAADASPASESRREGTSKPSGDLANGRILKEQETAVGVATPEMPAVDRGKSERIRPATSEALPGLKSLSLIGGGGGASAPSAPATPSLPTSEAAIIGLVMADKSERGQSLADPKSAGLASGAARATDAPIHPEKKGESPGAAKDADSDFQSVTQPERGVEAQSKSKQNSQAAAFVGEVLSKSSSDKVALGGVSAVTDGKKPADSLAILDDTKGEMLSDRVSDGDKSVEEILSLTPPSGKGPSEEKEGSSVANDTGERFRTVQILGIQEKAGFGILQGKLQGSPSGRAGSPGPAPLGETSPKAEAFSTFSLHVSDVSFQLARVALASGKWPEAEKIRIEEFVNAFDYGDPVPSLGERIACRIDQAAHPFLQQRNLVRIALRTAEAGRSATTPLRLTLLLDSSGSMERPDRRETLATAVRTLAGLLGKEDRITLVSFARQPRLVVDALPGNEASKLVETIASLPSEGGTNLEEALHLAFEKAREHREAKAQNRIVLLTDGAANLGDAKAESLASQVEAMREAGIAFDAAGFGAEGLNDEILEALTRKGDGRYYLLDRPEDAGETFAAQIAGALRPAAKNVKVQVEFNSDRVKTYKLLGFEKHRLATEDFRNDAVDAAELAAAEAGVAVYQVEPDPEGEGDLGSVSVRFRDLDSGEMIERRWSLPYLPAAPAVEESGNSIRLAAVASQFAAKLAGGPLGDVVDLDALAKLAAPLPEGAAAGELRSMIEQARSLEGTQ